MSKVARPRAAPAWSSCSATAVVGTDATVSPASWTTEACAAVIGPRRPTATMTTPIAPNRLAKAPNATLPNQIWVADITYIQTRQGRLSLAAFLDLYSRKIVGWDMSAPVDSTLVLSELSMALFHRDLPRKFALPLRSRGPVRRWEFP